MSAATNTLAAEVRDAAGSAKSRQLRHRGMVPGVLYGHGLGTVHLAVKAEELQPVLHTGAKVVSLNTPKGVESALIKEVQYDTFESEILHVDFARIAMDEAVTVQVPVELHGAHVGGGVIEHLLHTLNVKCRADQIPDKIRVEIGGMKIGDMVRVSNLKLPEGIMVLAEKEALVVGVMAPKEVVVAAAPAVEAAAEPELIAKKKEEEEEEGAAEAGEKPKAAEKPEKK